MTADFFSSVFNQLQTNQLINPTQLRELYQRYNNNPAQVLSAVEDQHLVRSEEIAKAKAAALNIGYVDLFEQQIPSEVLKIIPQETANNYQLIPWRVDSGIVSVAFAHPEDYRAIEALDFIGRQQKIQWRYFAASPLSIKQILRQYDNLSAEVEEALATADVSDIELETAEDDSKTLVRTAPVSKMISVILKHAIEGGASDVHIEPVGQETRVRYRLDGLLHTSLVLPAKVHKALIARIKVLANLKLDETRLPQDGRFRMRFEGRDVEFRVSSLPLLDNEKVVMRILDTAASVLTLEELGFYGRNLERISDHLKRPHGLILVTGPTGSGKSTTLYSMLTILNKEGVNIITLEDPVEYHLAGIAQAQMKPEIGLTFATGLRSVLRQDPDMIMVGEIRDNETAELAVHAALTGHMVLSTLHTNDAFGAIPRLMDMKVEPFLIASSLNLVVAQRLVRKLCQYCKELVTVDKSREQEIVHEIKKMPTQFLPRDVSLLPPFAIYQGHGCNHCEDTGYHGRVAINEVLENTRELSKIIGEGQAGDIDIVQQEFLRQGMFTVRQDGLIKVFRGLTTLEEVWNATKE
ncbi:MAG: type II/IV secretion system protein [Candidatus Kerfeldbacteria bacterium]|nr:type II/IV secretion system protein [Candidatus Kerfeldbacteria bacterium]